MFFYEFYFLVISNRQPLFPNLMYIIYCFKFTRVVVISFFILSFFFFIILLFLYLVYMYVFNRLGYNAIHSNLITFSW